MTRFSLYFINLPLRVSFVIVLYAGMEIPKLLIRTNWVKLWRPVRDFSSKLTCTICIWPDSLRRQTRSARIHPIHFQWSSSCSLWWGRYLKIRTNQAEISFIPMTNSIKQDVVTWGVWGNTWTRGCRTQWTCGWECSDA